MPNIWTHNLFGEAVVRQDGTRPWLDRHELKQLFHLGCQGPDFLFYHRFFPWQRKSVLPELGSRMHSEACGPALMRMAQTVSELRAKPDDPITVYVVGFMMHHILDRNAHPYIFTKSGSRKWDHQRFEVIIDTLMVRQALGIATWATPVWQQIDIGSDMPAPVIDMLAQIAEIYYPDAFSRMEKSQWNEAYRDMIRAQRIFHDPYGIKRVITLGQIEPLVYKRRNPERDYLNKARARWRHPALEHESSTASFSDLWDEAMLDASRVWNAVFQYWSDPSAVHYDELFEAIGNRSYEHGEPVDLGLAIRFEEPIWSSSSL